jgi:hypothetical protein
VCRAKIARKILGGQRRLIFTNIQFVFYKNNFPNFAALKRVKMKTIAFTFTFLIISLIGWTQETFEITISDTSYQTLSQVIESNDSYVIVSTRGNINSNNHHTHLLRIDLEGKILNSKLMKPDAYFYALYKLMEFGDGFIGFGYQKDSVNANAIITIAEMNSDFLIVNEKHYETNYTGISYVEVLKSIDNIVIFFSGITDSYQHQLCAYKISNDLDTICSKRYSSSGTKLTFDILSSAINDLTKVFVRGFAQYTNTPSQILMMDSSLNISAIKGIPEGIGLYIDAKPLDDYRYILTGKKTVWNSSPQDDQMAIALMDATDSLLSFEMLGAPDTLDYPGVFGNMDFKDPENIFYAGTKNLSPYGIFANSEAWFVLNKLNSSLELQWQKFYGGTANYQLIDMISTQDGGCLLAGNRYDYQTSLNETDIYIVKVNEDGLIVGTGEELPRISAQDAIVYPNPSNEYFTIQSGPQINGALFELFDMNGNLVHTTTLDERLETISTIKLSTGTYPYRITFDNKIVGSGKWMKQ